MTAKELREALKGAHADAVVVFCSNPGPGAVAQNIGAAMETKLEAIDPITKEKSLANVVVLVGVNG